MTQSRNRQKACLAELEFVEVDGLRMAYRDSGGGPPVVMLHCWTGSSELYGGLFDCLSSSFRCVAPDLPGHGVSAKIDTYSIDRITGTVAGLLEELELERPVLVGHSLGGMVALLLALDFLADVRALVLIDTSARLREHLLQRVYIAPALRLGRFAIKPVRDLVINAMTFYPRTGLDIRWNATKISRRTTNSTMVKVLEGLGDFDVLDRLGELDCPALVVVGRWDILADQRHSRELAQGIPTALLRRIDEAGHMSLLEKPDEVCDAVRGFLGTLIVSTTGAAD